MPSPYRQDEFGEEETPDAGRPTRAGIHFQRRDPRAFSNHMAICSRWFQTSDGRAGRTA